MRTSLGNQMLTNRAISPGAMILRRWAVWLRRIDFASGFYQTAGCVTATLPSGAWGWTLLGQLASPPPP